MVSTDLVEYCAASMPESDTTTSGGAIDTLRRAVFTDIAANDQIRIVSASAGDTTQTVTVTGRNAAGAIVAASATLNGTTPVVLSPTTTFERVLKVEMSAGAAGAVTVERNTAPNDDVCIIPVGERGARRLFYDSASETGATTRFEKTFGYNKHAAQTLNNAVRRLAADPAAKIRMGIATSKNDAVSVANRKTTPGGITFVDDNVDQTVTGSTLEALSGIGTWWELALLANDSPQKTNFTSRLSGTSV